MLNKITDRTAKDKTGRRNGIRSEFGGSSIVEAGASMALLVPLLVLLMMFVVQVSQYFVIKQQLAYIARMVAKETANAYGKLNMTSMNSNHPLTGSANTSDANYQSIANGVSMPGVFNLNSGAQIQTQFVIPNSPSYTNAYVKATVTYANGPNLPTFPWSPLKAGWLNFSALGIQVRTSGSWPIPH